MKHYFRLVFALFWITLTSGGIAHAGFEEDFRQHLYDGMDMGTDAILIMEDGGGGTPSKILEIPVHLSVLASKSAYFQYVTEFKKCSSPPQPELDCGKIKVPLSGISQDSFKRVIYFLYQNQLRLDGLESFSELMDLSDFLGIPDLRQPILKLIGDSFKTFGYESLAKALIFLDRTASLPQPCLNALAATSDSELPAANPSLESAPRPSESQYLKKKIIQWMASRHGWSESDYTQVLPFLVKQEELRSEVEVALKDESPEALDRKAKEQRGQRLDKQAIQWAKAERDKNKYVDRHLARFQKRFSNAVNRGHFRSNTKFVYYFDNWLVELFVSHFFSPWRKAVSEKVSELYSNKFVVKFVAHDSCIVVSMQ